MQGKYIVCEGIDGSGKSTMSMKLKEYLGDVAIHTRHPGATPLGQRLRHITHHDKEVTMDKFTEQVLMFADLSCFINTILIPKLNEGRTVICDRSNIISGLAYGSAGNVDPGTMSKLQDTIEMPQVDLLLIYLCKWENAKKRITNRAALDKFESRGDAYFEAVSKAYTQMSIEGTPIRNLVVRRAKNIKFIDADDPIEEVWNCTKRIVDVIL